MADVSIVAAATANVPRDYLIPGAQEILPKSVSAQMDGSAAASAWFPCLQVLDPSGRVMFSAVSSTAMAAGASADVSWFPRVTSAPGGSSQTLIGARIQAGSTQSVPDSTPTDLVYQSVYFDTDGMANLASDSRKLTVNTSGIYLVIAQTLWAYDGAGRRVNEVIQNALASGGSIPSQFFSDSDAPANWSPIGGDGFGGPRTTSTSVGLFNAAVGDFFASGCYQNSGGALNCNGFANSFLSAVLIGS